MKTYHGSPDGSVTVKEGDQERPLLADVKFGWGRDKSLAAAPIMDGAAPLALALAVDVTGDETRGLRVYRRFLWRTVAQWTSGQPWSHTAAEFQAAIADIEAVEVAAAGAKAAISAMPSAADIVSDTGRDVVWDSDNPIGVKR